MEINEEIADSRDAALIWLGVLNENKGEPLRVGEGYLEYYNEDIPEKYRGLPYFEVDGYLICYKEE